MVATNKFIDLSGKRNGSLIIIEYDKQHQRWKCKCDCGSIIYSKSGVLINGIRKSCGCNNPNKFQNLVGNRFGKLTVIQFDHKEGKGTGAVKYFWKCKCDCGNETVVRKGHLKSGAIQSCGCLSHRKGKNSPHYKGYEEISGWYYQNLKKGATYRNRNFSFDVSIEYLWELFLKQKRKCALTGLDLQFSATKKDRTASLDRIDSTKGYIKDNVQWVHKDINRMKNIYDNDYFMSMCEQVANHKNRGIINQANEQSSI